MELGGLLNWACLILVLAIVYLLRRSKFGFLATSLVRVLSGCFLGACILGGLGFVLDFVYLPRFSIGLAGMLVGFALALIFQLAVLSRHRCNGAN